MEDTIEEGRLPDGLRYYIRQTDLIPGAVCLALSVRAGSLYDGRQKGIAHLVEHCNMSFEKYREFHPSCRYHARAYTDYDSTNYIFSCRKEEIPDIFEKLQRLLAGKYQKPEQFREIKRDVIREWHRKQADQDYRMMRLFFENTAYGRELPVGDPETVCSLSFQEVQQFFACWYVPERIAISVVGDVPSGLTDRIKKLECVKPECAKPGNHHGMIPLLPDWESGLKGTILAQENSLYYFYILRWKEQIKKEEYVKENFRYDICHDVISKALAAPGRYRLDKKGCQRVPFSYLQELFYFSVQGREAADTEDPEQMEHEILSIVLSWLDENFENLRQEYIEAFRHYKDYYTLEGMLGQCISHDLYGIGLVDCVFENKILSGYIYEITKCEIQTLLWKIFGEVGTE